MMMRMTIKPVPGGWAVDRDISEYPLMFLSGGAAERSARRTAAAFSGLGVDVELKVYDRDGWLIDSVFVRAH